MKKRDRAEEALWKAEKSNKKSAALIRDIQKNLETTKRELSQRKKAND